MDKQKSDYKTKRINKFIKTFVEFLESCERMKHIVDDYDKTYSRIRQYLRTITKDDKMNITHEMQVTSYNLMDTIFHAFKKTDYGNYLGFASIRTYLEFVILENIGIKLKKIINETNPNEKITYIAFTSKFTYDDMTKIIDMLPIKMEDKTNIKQIINWGHRSIHQTQLIPYSLAYYSLYYISEKLFEMLNVDIPSQQGIDKYHELHGQNKIKIYTVDHFFPNLYHFYYI